MLKLARHLAASLAHGSEGGAALEPRMRDAAGGEGARAGCVAGGGARGVGPLLLLLLLLGLSVHAQRAHELPAHCPALFTQQP